LCQPEANRQIHFRLFTGEDFEPGDRTLAAVRLFNSSINNAPRCFPNVSAGAIAFDE